MKRRFIIEQIDKPLLERGVKSAPAFRLYTRGRTWQVTHPKINFSGKRRSTVRVIAATAALA